MNRRQPRSKRIDSLLPYSTLFLSHACNYLLANDIDLELVPGYPSASWEQGYGDYLLKPDLATLRLTPWLEGTATVLCDVLDHHHDPVPHSQIGRAHV